MGRGAKKQAPEGWQGVADASAAQDEEAGGNDGVVMDAGGPVYLEPLTEAERAQAGGILADKLAELAEIEQDAKDSAAKYRKDVKARKKAIATLRDEVREGTRRVAAQKALPGTEAH